MRKIRLSTSKAQLVCNKCGALMTYVDGTGYKCSRCGFVIKKDSSTCNGCIRPVDQGNQ